MSHKFEGRALDASIDGLTRPMMVKAVGQAAPTCPFWIYAKDEFVREVVRTYHAESWIGQAHMGGIDDAPRRLVEGLLEYDIAHRNATAFVMAADRKRREAEAEAKKNTRRR